MSHDHVNEVPPCGVHRDDQGDDFAPFASGQDCQSFELKGATAWLVRMRGGAPHRWLAGLWLRAVSFQCLENGIGSKTCIVLAQELETIAAELRRRAEA